MRKIISVALAVISLFCAYSQTEIKHPDFAYPRDVLKNAEVTLQKARATGNTPLILQSAIDMTLADMMINQDSLDVCIRRLELLRDSIEDVSGKSMLDLLLATLYSNYFQQNRWRISQRVIPDGFNPESIDDWDNGMFERKIEELVDSVLIKKSVLQRIPLRDLGKSIEIDKDSYIFFPTVYDFAAYKAVELLRQLQGDYKSRIKSIYKSLETTHEQGSPAWIYAYVSEIIDNVTSESRETIADNLWRLYESNKNKEYSCYILQKIQSFVDIPDQQYRLYHAVNDALKSFPGYKMRNCVENIILQLGRKNLTFNTPPAVVPGDDMKIQVSSANINKYALSLYKIDGGFDSGSYFKFNGGVSSRKIESKTVMIEGKIPFENDTSICFRVSEPGYYFVTASFEGQNQVKNPSYGKIFCSDFQSNVMKFDDNTLVVVNPKTGEPQTGVGIFLDRSQRSSEKYEKIGSTDRSGFYMFKQDESGSVSVRKGADIYARPLYVGRIGKEVENTVRIAGFTDLGVYHPGDSVRWVAIVYDADKNGRVMENSTVRAILKDASYQSVDTIEGITDDFGRMTGAFKLPEGRMNGWYSIHLNSGNSSGQIRFEVSDYKLPTFEVSISNVNSDISDGNPVIIKGKSIAYSGMPVMGADVTARVVFEQGWWRYSSSKEVCNMNSKTDSSGDFSLEVPADMFSEYKNGRFRVNIAVTSETGESQQATSYFSLRPSFGILVSLPKNIDLEQPLGLNVRVVSQEGVDTIMTVGLKLTDSSTDKTYAFSFKPGEKINLNNLPSGVYDAKLYVVDNDCDTINVNRIGFYRLSDKMPPKNSEVLWVADNNMLSGSNLLVGTYAEKSWILYTFWTDNEILEQKWLECGQGFHNLPVSLPDDIAKGKVTLVSTSGYNTVTLDITISNPSAEEKIEIITETFRDKITPGEEETWTLRVKNKTGNGVEAGVILDMYNAALDQIMGNNLIFNPVKLNDKYFSFRSYYFGKIYSNISSDIRYLKCTDIQTPDFQTYGYGFLSHYPMPLVNGMKLMSRTTSKESAEVVIEDALAMADSGATTESAIDEEEDREESEIKREEFDYRPSEVALALFRPTLTTTEDGTITFAFKVPAANTTWRFMALAFTKKLLTTQISKNIVASKKIMVTPNLPRFLRNGDKIIIKASVFNNTDSDFPVLSRMEFFNPITDETITESETKLELKAGESTIVETELTVPADLNFIGFRIKAVTDLASDGEQALIPVLPSTVDVFESEPFFLAPDEKDFTRNFNNIHEDEQVTLEYCDNPLWYVVTALPGLINPSTNTSTDIAAALFSTIVAGKLPEVYPILKNAIHYWTEDGRKDSMLVSALEKNQDLKTVLLQMTPWQEIAAGETEQMERLAMIFNQKQVENSIFRLKERLNDVQQTDGGFAWMASYKRSSEWSTLQILNILGRLNKMVCLPEDKGLKSMIDKAMGYIQSLNVEAYNRNNNGSFIEFARLCCYFPEFKRSMAGDKVYRHSIQYLVKNWNKLDVKGKAEAAMILFTANYRTLSKQILKSLEQFSVSSKGKGSWWANSNDGTLTETSVLEAYSMIEPSNPMVDKIIERLIYQKLNQKWDNSFRTTATIATMLNNTSHVRSETGDVELKVNGKTLSERNSIFSGEIKVNLSEMIENGNKFELSRKGDSPAWGSFFMKYTSNADSVNSVSSGQIIIRKAISVLEDGQLKEKTSMKTGDRVRVTLALIINEDADYVAIIDERAACMEPVEQLPKPIYQEGLCFYRENGDSSTKIFIDHLPKGTYFLTYDLWVNNAGIFTSGIATVQSQYSPQITAHSGARKLIVADN